MSKNTPQRGNWFVTASLVGLTVIYLLVFYLPGKKAMRQLSDELELKRQSVAQADQLRAQIELAQGQLADARQYVSARHENFAGASTLFAELSRLSNAAGVHTTRFEPAPASEQQQLYQYAVAIGCSGSFAQIYQLLQGVERLPEPIWIDELRIERKEANQGELQCELKLVVFADKAKISD